MDRSSHYCIGEGCFTCEKAKRQHESDLLQRRVIPLDPRVAKIHANRVLKITADIDHLRNREDCELIKDELDQAIRLLFKAVKTLEA